MLADMVLGALATLQRLARVMHLKMCNSAISMKIMYNCFVYLHHNAARSPE